MNWTGQVIDGRYQILGLIGQGGMGAVYEAQHALLGRRHAIKFMHPELVQDGVAVERFCREAKIAASLGHPHIVHVADMGFGEDGAPYIVMEYLEGENLYERLKRRGKLSLEAAESVMLPALSALQAAHVAGIVHRDMKPENIFLSVDRAGREVLKVLDFGVAKLSHSGSLGLTRTEAVLGTPQYMSPEQASGYEAIDHRCDIYAMGVVFYEMLTGALPFEAPNYNALMVQIMNGLSAEAVSRLNVEASAAVDIVQTAMAQEPGERFEQCRNFAERIQEMGSPNRAPHVIPTAGRTSGDAARVATAEMLVDAIFIGLDGLQTDGGESGVLNSLVLNDASTLPETLERSMPQVIVATGTIDFEAIVERFPVFRIPTITVDLLAAGRELQIREWEPTHSAFVLSEASMAELELEIRRLCDLPPPLCLHRNAIFDVGLSDRFEGVDGAVQVVTEAVCQGDVRVRSKIMREGRVLEQTTEPFEPTSQNGLEQLRRAVRQQHSEVLERARDLPVAGVGT